MLYNRLIASCDNAFFKKKEIFFDEHSRGGYNLREK